VRFSPESCGEASGYEQTDDTHPHGNNRAADENLGLKDEASEMCDGNQRKHEDGEK